MTTTFEPGRSSNAVDADRVETTATRSALPTRRRTTRRLGLLGLLLAAMLFASAGTHWLDSRSATGTAPWAAACQDAISATARLHRQQVKELAQGMREAWTLIGGGEISDPTYRNTVLDAQLQRDADSAVSRCISPAMTHP
jgi:hypothetical protein